MTTRLSQRYGGADVPAGVRGEIVYKHDRRSGGVPGRQLMAGYWRNRKATDETLVDGWLLTPSTTLRGRRGSMRKRPKSGTRQYRRGRFAILTLRVCLYGCVGPAATLPGAQQAELFSFERYEVVTGAAERQTILTGLRRRPPDLVRSRDRNGTRTRGGDLGLQSASAGRLPVPALGRGRPNPPGDGLRPGPGRTQRPGVLE